MDSNYTIRFRILPIMMLLAAVATGCTTIHPLVVENKPALMGNAFSHTAFDRVLGEHVDDVGRVDYKALKAASEDIQTYYQMISTYSPDSHPSIFPSDNHRLAYWINAYNAAAMIIVLKHYPIDSVLDVKNPALLFFLSDKAGFFVFQRLSFGAQTTSLYYLENQVIRKRFKDPRIHFAVNCASIGCPRLPVKAFSGELLDEQLDKETRLFLTEARNFRINHGDKTIYLSSIFKWYKKDFTDWYQRRYPERETSLLSYIKLYLTPEKSEILEKAADRYGLKFIPYDWGLNDQTASK